MSTKEYRMDPLSRRQDYINNCWQLRVAKSLIVKGVEQDGCDIVP